MTKSADTEVESPAPPQVVASAEKDENLEAASPESPAAATSPTSNGPPTSALATPAPNAANPKKGALVHKADYEKDVVYLYQFSRFPTLPSASPFCLKVETWLRMAGVKYENVDHKLKLKSKKGQLPFVEFNGAEIADSDIIIKELSKQLDKDLDHDLNPDQRNVSHAFISMLNNHTSWVVRWWRYSHPGQFLKTAQVDIKRTLNSKLPKGLLQFVFKMSLKSNVKQAVSHGMGRHTSEEIIEFGKNDLKAISEVLADKQYFFGSEPHLLDCVAFAHLCQFIYVPFGDLKEFIESECSNLTGFVGRMKERYWPDWDDMCKSLELNTHLPKKQEDKPQPEDEKKEKEEDKKEKGGEDEKEDKKADKEEEKGDKDKDKSGEPDEEKDKDTEKPVSPPTPQDNKEIEENEASKKTKEEPDNAQKE